jgi:hypothetical protein
MSNQQYEKLIDECENFNKSIRNIMKELESLATYVVNETTKPSEKDIIDLYNKVQINVYAIERLQNYHRKLDGYITNLRDRYCNHDRVVDDNNFDISHTCYVCSKCGMIM